MKKAKQKKTGEKSRKKSKLNKLYATLAILSRYSSLYDLHNKVATESNHKVSIINQTIAASLFTARPMNGNILAIFNMIKA